MTTAGETPASPGALHDNRGRDARVPSGHCMTTAKHQQKLTNTK
ncbi:MAG: hypothetical protein ACI3Z8_00695 [Paludibacteraceae bacterium]